MLDFVIFAVTFVVALLLAVFYLYPGSRRHTTIPGSDPSDVKDGNLPDILHSGSLHVFLKKAHETYGPITGFWLAEQYVVSLASPELFKEHRKAYDHPDILLKAFQPLLGSRSILFSNGSCARNKRKYYSECFTEANFKKFLQKFVKIGDDLSKKWETLPKDQHIPLHQYMTALSLKSILSVAFGSAIQDEKKIVEFNRCYEIVWSELKAREFGPIPNANSPQEKTLQNGIETLHGLVRCIIEDGKKSKLEDECFLSILLKEHLQDDEIQDEIMTFIFSGFHTVGSMLTWTLYFLATHHEVQKKLNDELIKVIGTSQSISMDTVNKTLYTNQVIKESLRCSVVSPYTFRSQDIDTEIGGHIIPKGTPIIHALGVVLQDEKYWPQPNTFDPERFDAKREPPSSYTLCPFGFAGERLCPGEKMAQIEAVVYVSILCRKFVLHIVEDQLVVPSYGFVTCPEDEIWITVTSRD